jgi:transposase
VATVFEVRDEIWEVVEPMIPPVKVPERQGRRPVADRVCFEAIVFVMITGIAWGHLPSELGCSGVTAWRRLRDWQLAGVWERLRAALLQKLNAAGAIDWSAAVVDGSHIRGSAAPNCTRPSCTWPARSSASASSELCETSSKGRGNAGATCPTESSRMPPISTRRSWRHRRSRRT